MSCINNLGSKRRMSYFFCRNIAVGCSVCLLQFYENSPRLRQYYNTVILDFMLCFIAEVFQNALQRRDYDRTKHTKQQFPLKLVYVN